MQKISTNVSPFGNGIEEGDGGRFPSLPDRVDRLVQKVSSEAQNLSDFLFPGLFCTFSVLFWRCPAIKQALSVPALWHSTNETLGMAIILTELMRIRVENPD